MSGKHTAPLLPWRPRAGRDPLTDILDTPQAPDAPARPKRVVLSRPRVGPRQEKVKAPPKPGPKHLAAPPPRRFVRRRPPAARVPSLDGLRGISAVLIVIFHMDLASVAGGAKDFLPGGWLGVDVFFALSGYLVTSRVLADREAGAMSLVWFDLRRATRLLPGLAVLCLGAGVWVSYVDPSIPEASTTLRAVPGALAGTIDLSMAAGRGWTAGLLQHTWSAAIELKFYLLWPILLLALLKVGRRPLAGLAALGAAVGAALWNVHLYRLLHDSDPFPRIYFAPDVRSAALFAGAFLAVLPLKPLATSRWTRWPIGVIAAAAAAGLGYLAATNGYLSPFALGGWSYLLDGTLAGLVVLACVAAPRTPVPMLLALPPVVWLGRISYGLYLWHYPVVLLFRFPDLDDWSRRGVQGAIAIVLATISWWAIERPCLQWLRKAQTAVGEDAAAHAF